VRRAHIQHAIVEPFLIAGSCHQTSNMAATPPQEAATASPLLQISQPIMPEASKELSEDRIPENPPTDAVDPSDLLSQPTTETAESSVEIRKANRVSTSSGESASNTEQAAEQTREGAPFKEQLQGSESPEFTQDRGLLSKHAWVLVDQVILHLLLLHHQKVSRGCKTAISCEPSI
jgi:hypothetical protein